MVKEARDRAYATGLVVARGTTDRAEALDARDNHYANEAALVFLEAEHAKLRGSHTTNAATHAEAALMTRWRAARGVLSSMASTFSGPWGISSADVVRLAEQVAAKDIGFLLVAAPEAIESIQPRTRAVVRGEPPVTDRTPKEFAEWVTFLVKRAVELNAK